MKRIKFFDRKMNFLIGFLLVIGAVMMTFGPADSLDTKLYYSGNEARSLFQSFSSEDLKSYFINELLDLCFIVSYTCLFTLCLGRLYSSSCWTVVLPLAVGLFDLIETGVVLAVIKLSLSKSVFNWLGTFTFLKWSVGAFAFLLLVGGLIQRKFFLSEDLPRSKEKRM